MFVFVCLFFCYAHIEIVVTFLAVNFVDLLVITQHHAMHFWHKLEEIVLSASRSFLYLLEAFLEATDPSCLEPKFSRKNKNVNDYFHVSIFFPASQSAAQAAQYCTTKSDLWPTDSAALWLFTVGWDERVLRPADMRQLPHDRNIKWLCAVGK